MKRAALAFALSLEMMTPISCWATDPNEACVKAYPAFRDQLRDASHSSRNMMAGLIPLLGLPADSRLSELAAAIREFGSEDVVGRLAENWAIQHVRDPTAYRAESIEQAKKGPVLPFLQDLPDLFEQAFVFRDDLRAVSYDLNLDRTTCQVHYYHDLDYVSRWVISHGGDQTDRPAMEALMRAVKSLMAAGQWPTARYDVQPDGKGGTRVFILPNIGPTPVN
jgi:hypothetical protein